MGVTRKSKVVSFSTKNAVGTNADGGQDGGHHNEREEQQEAPHVDRKQRGGSSPYGYEGEEGLI